MIKTKKAQTFLGKHVIEIVISIIVLCLLIYLGFLVYGMIVGPNNEFRQAESQLENIVGVINSLEEGGSKEVILLNPKGWSINDWSHLDESPDDCLGKNCFCICDYDLVSFGFETALKECNTPGKGICVPFDEIISSPSIVIHPPMTLKISKQENEVIINEVK